MRCTAIAGDSQPPCTTLAEFTRTSGEGITQVFTQVLVGCDRQGLIGRPAALSGRAAGRRAQADAPPLQPPDRFVSVAPPQLSQNRSTPDGSYPAPSRGACPTTVGSSAARRPVLRCTPEGAAAPREAHAYPWRGVSAGGGRWWGSKGTRQRKNACWNSYPFIRSSVRRRRRLGRISDHRAVHPGKRRQRVYLAAGPVDNFLDEDAVDHQRVGDQ